MHSMLKSLSPDTSFLFGSGKTVGDAIQATAGKESRAPGPAGVRGSPLLREARVESRGSSCQVLSDTL